MSVLGFITGAVDKVTGLIDELVTTDEERGVIKNELRRVENMFAEKVLDYESRMMELRSNIIMTEAKGESWLQRSWRPVTMLTFLVLVVLHHLGALAIELSDQMWGLLKIGVGGYIGSRGAEKIVPALMSTLNKKKEDRS
jgi:hypothetical protein